MHSQQPSSQPNEVNQTSGGVTIVKLNSPTIGNGIANGKPIPAVNNQTATKLFSPILNGGTSLSVASSSTVPAAISQITTTTSGGHIVTIHTSSITSVTQGTTLTAIATVTTASSSGSTATPVNGNTVTSNPPHTGYTRRAKLGDSRSTGRLHSAGNTHRSMTRLNIAGKWICKRIQNHY